MGWPTTVFITALFLGSWARCESVKRTFNGSTMQLSVPPIKATDAREETCIRWQTNSVASVISVQINRIDFPTYVIDEKRFGPTSVQLGRQKLQLEIRDPANNDNLILKDKNIPVNGRSLTFSVTNLSTLDMCFTNLSFDSSWNAIDMESELEISVYVVKQPDLAVVSPMSVQDLDLLYMTSRHSHDYLGPRFLESLVASEALRRDLNESTYSWLLYKFLLLSATLVLCYCVLVPGYLMYLASGRDTHNAKFYRDHFHYRQQFHHDGGYRYRRLRLAKLPD